MECITPITRVDQSTKEQWTRKIDMKDTCADRILNLLKQLQTIERTGRFAIDQYQHCLQTATRAERDGADEELVFVCLVHDIGKALVGSHGHIAAEIIKPFVRDELYQMIKYHQDFEGYWYYHHLGRNRYEREKYKNEPWYELGIRFADEWDMMSFDPDYDTFPLEHFEPLVRKIARFKKIADASKSNKK